VERKLLAPLRLSRFKDSSTNPASQRSRITDYAEDHGDNVIFVDVDMDVSGAMPIRGRPGLGPWLAPDRIGQLDGFLADEMDRLSRDMLDYLQFARDMAALGKVIIDVSDGTDTSTERGRQALEDRILAAQRERERIATRRRRAAKRLADKGRWGGGKPGYGYAPRCVCHGEHPCPDPQHTTGWWRVQDPDEAPIVMWMVQQRIAGKGFRAIADELNERGVPAPRGGKWNATTVGKILTSPLLVGHVVEMKGESGVKGMPFYKKGQITGTRRGKDGQPIMFTYEPLIDDQDTWDQLQEAIKADSRARGQAQSRHLLYRVFFCRSCSPKPFDPATDVRMYGARRHTPWQEPLCESVEFSQDQLSAFGAFLLDQRKQAGLSLRQLAGMTTVSDSQLNKIERGLERPSVRTLRLIAGWLGMTIETLLTEVSPDLVLEPERQADREHPGYYTCKACNLHIRIDRIEPLIEALVLKEVGGRVLLEKRVVHGDDHAAAISRLERAAERRRELLADDPGDDDLKESLAKTEAQITALRNQPHEPDTFEWREVSAGIKVADHWAALDTAGRAKFLRDWEVTCFADRDGAEVRLGWLEIYGEAFRLRNGESRLVPTALPALITHAQEWQRVPGAVLPARVAAPGC
jgi:DNA invertase Pin-like site-specific DNA recombinase/transcriptional regulator with XRE-family HTH domain